MNQKKLAEQFDEMSALCAAIAGTFRASGGGGGTAEDDAPSAKRASARKGKAAKVEEGPTVDEVRAKLKELMDAKGKDVMVAALETVGAGKLGDVDESQYKELLDTAQGMLDEEEGVSLEELTEAAKGLLAADKPAYTKLVKKFGKPSECEEEKYADFLEAITAAMPAEEDNLL